MSGVLEIGEDRVRMGGFLEFDLGFPLSVSALVLVELKREISERDGG